MAAHQLDASRSKHLVNLGVDEISWRKHHNYLTLVSDHETSTIIWGAAGQERGHLGQVLHQNRTRQDGLDSGGEYGYGSRFPQVSQGQCTKAAIRIDPFHVVQLATNALEILRREQWQAARTLPDQQLAKKYKGHRFALLKNPGTLTDTQQATLDQLRDDGGTLWEGYQLKESLREIFAGDLHSAEVMAMIQYWCDAATDIGLAPFVKAGATLRGHINGIHAGITRGLSNGKHEGLNNKIRTMTRRAYGFHSPQAALALIMLACGPVKVKLPYHT